VREELVEAVLRVVEEIPPGRAATYGMIAQAVGTGPRVVGRIMHDWGGGVPWWRVVNVHGTFPTTIRGEGFSEWEKEGMPHDLERGKLHLKQCAVEQEWLDSVARTVIENLQNAAELSG
jgi:alkylated DNA nucleotide flippase Atl1